MNHDQLLTQLSQLLIEHLQHQNSTQKALQTPKQANTASIKDALAYRLVAQKNRFGVTQYALTPLVVSRHIQLSDLLGIDIQKQKIIQNTEQFLAGFPANHVLLSGTRGAGKSSLIRALLSQYASQGLRLIEVTKAHLASLSELENLLSNIHNEHSYRYIIYCDDLAFNQEDEHYRTLKSMLDGSVASMGDNFLIYATSNRRHLVPQYMRDNVNIYEGRTDEVNPLEQVDETVSLSDRFGLWLSFHPMPQQVFLDIVNNEITKAQLIFDTNTKAAALTWAASRGGRSGRVAYQFARHWVGNTKLAQLTKN